VICVNEHSLKVVLVDTPFPHFAGALDRRRWVVEKTYFQQRIRAWLERCISLWRDFEAAGLTCQVHLGARPSLSALKGIALLQLCACARCCTELKWNVTILNQPVFYKEREYHVMVERVCVLCVRFCIPSSSQLTDLYETWYECRHFKHLLFHTSCHRK
jgi:hypothetical protein